MADIRLDSRYSRAQLKLDRNNVEYVDWFGDIKFMVEDFDDNIEYQVKPSDTVFTIADNFYGQGKYYWVVCRANMIFNPFLRLKPGVKLIIPSLNTFRTKILGET